MTEKIVFDFDDPMGASTCVACGECVQACPTGALMPATVVNDNNVRTEFADRTVDWVCPYCGVGCQLTYHIKDDKLLYVTGRERPGQREPAVREGPLRLRLCQQSAAPDAADDPQGRRAESPARGDRPGQPVDAFPPGHLGGGARQGGRRASRPSATATAPRALAGFGSAKCSNEEAYLFQKLVRAGFGTNNVDHCTRLCHASSVAALLEGVGSGAVSATFNEVQELRRHHRHRLQSDREPSGRRHLLQAGGQARRQADRHGSARAGLEAPRLAHAAVQERRRRGDAQRHAQHHRHRRALRQAICADLYRGLRPVRRAHQGFHAGGNGADLRHPGRHVARGGAHLCAARRAPSSSGAWASRSTPTAPTMRAA